MKMKLNQARMNNVPYTTTTTASGDVVNEEEDDVRVVT